MNKKQVLRQIRNLSAKQCKQLEVEEPFDGEGSVEAVMAWLGDGILYGADGAELDIAAVFAADDPATLSLHSGMPDAEEPQADEMVATEVVTSANVPAVEEAMELQAETQAAIRRGVRDAIRKTGKTALPRTGGVQVGSVLGRKSKHFASKEDQYVAGQWIGAKLFKIPSAQKWWNNNGSYHMGRKQQLEGGATTGGNLVPTPLEQSILAVREEYGVARRICRVFPMTADTLAIPSLTTGATVRYPNEGGAITIGDAAWGAVNLTAVKRACLMKWSAELGADSLFSLADVLSDYIGRALGIEEDKNLIQGDGSAASGGVGGLEFTTHTASTSAGSTWAAMTLAEIVTAAGTLGDKYQTNASWLCSRQFYVQVILRVVAGAGGNTIDTLGLGTTGAQFLGYPIHFSDQAPSTSASGIESCWFGDFQGGVVFGDRTGVELATSEHADFANDLINIRGTSRYDIQVHDQSSYISFDTA